MDFMPREWIFFSTAPTALQCQRDQTNTSSRFSDNGTQLKHECSKEDWKPFCNHMHAWRFQSLTSALADRQLMSWLQQPTEPWFSSPDRSRSSEMWPRDNDGREGLARGPCSKQSRGSYHTDERCPARPAAGNRVILVLVSGRFGSDFSTSFFFQKSRNWTKWVQQQNKFWKSKEFSSLI